MFQEEKEGDAGEGDDEEDEDLVARAEKEFFDIIEKERAKEEKKKAQMENEDAGGKVKTLILSPTVKFWSH